jgi:hypothetical protein
LEPGGVPSGGEIEGRQRQGRVVGAAGRVYHGDLAHVGGVKRGPGAPPRSAPGTPEVWISGRRGAVAFDAADCMRRPNSHHHACQDDAMLS